MLGPVSVLKFVTELCQPLGHARRVLDGFNANGSALLSVDLEKMASLLKPTRARWSSVFKEALSGVTLDNMLEELRAKHRLAVTDGMRDFWIIMKPSPFAKYDEHPGFPAAFYAPSVDGKQPADVWEKKDEMKLRGWLQMLRPRAHGMSASFLMSGTDQTSVGSEGRQVMADAKTLIERLGRIEGVVTLLDKRASESLIAPKLHDELRGLVGGLHFYNPGDQSKNDAWNVSGTPKVDTADGNAPLPASASHGSALGIKVETATPPSSTPVNAPKMASDGTAPAASLSETPSYDNFKQNTMLAENIIETVETTDQKIDTLVTAGRKFNASKAKGDLYAVASRVTEILNNVDLAQPWVRNDLTALADKAKQIHGLFASAKV